MMGEEGNRGERNWSSRAFSEQSSCASEPAVMASRRLRRRPPDILQMPPSGRALPYVFFVACKVHLAIVNPAHESSAISAKESNLITCSTWVCFTLNQRGTFVDWLPQAC